MVIISLQEIPGWLERDEGCASYPRPTLVPVMTVGNLASNTDLSQFPLGKRRILDIAQKPGRTALYGSNRAGGITNTAIQWYF
jgi:hypothetical protein